MIIEGRQRLRKQSMNWSMEVSNLNTWLTEIISPLNSFCLLRPLHPFVPLLSISLIRNIYKSSPGIERSERLMGQNQNVTVAMSSSNTHLKIDTKLMKSPCLLCPQFALVSLQNSHEIHCSSNAGLSKQCIYVKMLVGVICQNDVGMSKHYGYILSKWWRFGTKLDCIIIT